MSVKKGQRRFRRRHTPVRPGKYAASAVQHRARVGSRARQLLPDTHQRQGNRVHSV